MEREPLTEYKKGDQPVRAQRRERSAHGSSSPPSSKLELKSRGGVDAAAFSGACNAVIVCGEPQLWHVVCLKLVSCSFFVFAALVFCTNMTLISYI